MTASERKSYYPPVSLKIGARVRGVKYFVPTSVEFTGVITDVEVHGDGRSHDERTTFSIKPDKPIVGFGIERDWVRLDWWYGRGWEEAGVEFLEVV